MKPAGSSFARGASLTCTWTCTWISKMSDTEGLSHYLAVAKRYLQKPKSQELLLRSSALILIYLMAFSVRLVSWLASWSLAHSNAACMQALHVR